MIVNLIIVNIAHNSGGSLVIKYDPTLNTATAYQTSVNYFGNTFAWDSVNGLFYIAGYYTSSEQSSFLVASKLINTHTYFSNYTSTIGSVNTLYSTTANINLSEFVNSSNI